MGSAERGRLIRFAVVGVAVAAIYAALFLALTAAGSAPVLANSIAFGIAIAVQYLGQAIWTFESDAGRAGTVLKFAATIGLGYLLSTLISSVIGPALDWPPAAVVAVVMVVLPVSNYLLFRVWVFRD